VTSPRSYNAFYSAQKDEQNRLTFKSHFSIDILFNNLPKFANYEFLQNFYDTLNFVVQEVNGSNFDLVMEKLRSTDIKFGTFNTPGITELEFDSKLAIKIVRNNNAFAESLFYPWMMETISENWVYTSVPFTKANIKVTFYDSTNREPVYTITYFDCFPISVPLSDADQDSFSEINTAEITFCYNFAEMEYVKGNNLP